MFFSLVVCSTANNKYKEDDRLLVYANKIYPYDNPASTYDFSRYLFCTQKQKMQTSYSWVESFMGSKPVFADIIIEYNKNTDNKTICTNTLTKESAKLLRHIIENNYVIEFSIDKIPSWYRIGTTASDKAQIYSHLAISINAVNGTLTDVNITGTNPVDIAENTEIRFSFSSTFKQVNEKRLARIRNESYIKSSVHVYSLFNTSILAMLLILLVVLIRNKIFTKESISMKSFEGFEFESLNDRGWKAIKGDVFRPPQKMVLLALLSGPSTQILVFCLLYSFFMWKYNSESQFPLTFFAITAPLCGMVSVSLSQAFGIHKWLRISFGSISFIPLSAIVLLFPTYLMSIVNKTTFGVSIFNIIVFLIIFVIILIPLSSFGGFVAVKRKFYMGNKCEVTLIPRKVPNQPWYLKTPWLGFFSFIVCGIPATIEMHYILVSLWNPNVFYPFELLSIAVCLISANACCSSIISVYLLLQAENYHWQWQSFINPASTGLSTLIYSFIYFGRNTSMNGLFQTVAYFTISVFISFCISLLCGGIGFSSANLFVHNIYQNIKMD